MKPTLMYILTTDGVEEVEVRDVETAALIGRHWNAVQRVLEGDWWESADYAGATVYGKKLESDPDVIESRAHRGELNIEGPYVGRVK